MRAFRVLLVAAVMVAVMLPATESVAQEYVQVKEGCGTVVKVMGNTIITRNDETNKTRVHKNISPDIKWIIDGKDMTVYDLKEGMHGCAYRLVAAQPPIVVTIEPHEVETIVDEPDEYDTPPAPAPAPEPEPEPEPVLPKTGSQLPLAGLLGLALLAVSACIAIYRRF
jgi:LPXTG-motif cell wall-anchored protein